MRAILIASLILLAPLAQGQLAPLDAPDPTLSAWPGAGRFEAVTTVYVNVTELGAGDGAPPVPRTTVLVKLPEGARTDVDTYPADPTGWARGTDWALVNGRLQVLYETNLTSAPSDALRIRIPLAPFSNELCTLGGEWVIVVTVPGSEEAVEESEVRCDRAAPTIALEGTVATPVKAVPTLRARISDAELANVAGAADVRGYFVRGTQEVAARVTNVSGTLFDFTATSLVDGSYLLRVTANDSAGNSANVTLAASAFVLDQTAPSILVVSGVPTSAVNAIPTVRVRVIESQMRQVAGVGDVQGFFVAAVGTTAAVSAFNATDYDITAASLADGTYRLRVVATDAVGNVADVTLATSEFLLDQTLPTITAPVFDASAWHRADVTLVWTCSDAGSGVVRGDDSRTLSTDTASGSLTGRCLDGAGNVNESTITGIKIDKSAPALGALENMTVEAEGPEGANVTYALPIATDAGSGVSGAVSCLPVAGTTFALGETDVTCSVSDVASNAAEPLAFRITVSDTRAPVISAHEDILVESAANEGANVSYAAPATSDAVDGPGLATCAPASGSIFPFGNTTVRCTAIDAAGNAAVATGFIVRLMPIPLDLESIGDVEAEATDAAGAVIAFALPVATGRGASSATISCAPASGVRFPIGNTSVTCTAEQGGALVQRTFNVVVVDTIAPVIDAAPALLVEANSSAGAIVSYAAPPARDFVSGIFPSTCTPASGVVLPLGVTFIACEAEDAAGNVAVRTEFTIVVRDTTPPDIHVADVSASTSAGLLAFQVTDLVSNVTVNATLTLEDGTTSALELVTEGARFTRTPEGRHRLSIRAQDAAGNNATRVVWLNVTFPPPPRVFSGQLHAAPPGLAARFDAPGEVTRGESTVFSAAEDSRFTYRWTFGDGATSDGRVVSHAWAELGEFEVRLTVTTSDGRTAYAMRLLAVRDPTAPVAPAITVVPTADPPAPEQPTQPTPAATPPLVSARVPVGVVRSPAVINFEAPADAAVYWRLADQSVWTSSRTVEIPGDGVVRVEYYAVGPGGRGITQGFSIDLDGLAPTVEAFTFAFDVGAVTFEARVVDSHIDRVEVILRDAVGGEGALEPRVIPLASRGLFFHGSLRDVSDGLYEVEVRAVDVLGRETIVTSEDRLALGNAANERSSVAEVSAARGVPMPWFAAFASVLFAALILRRREDS